MDHRCNTSHEPRSRRERFFWVFLEVMINRDNTLGRKLPDLGLPIRLPAVKFSHPELETKTWMATYQSVTYGVFRTRSGRPVYIRVVTASSYPADKTISLCVLGALASTHATKRVPTHTPCAPHMRFAASPRPSYTAPAPTTYTGPPVSEDV